MPSTADLRGRTALVTGATGFLGAHVAEELVARGATVLCPCRSGVLSLPPHDRLRPVRLDLLDRSGLARLVAAYDVDLIVHSAARDGTPEDKRLRAGTMIDENVRMVSNVLDSARRGGVADTVLVSSSDVYAGTVPWPVRETEDHHTDMRFAQDGFYLSKVHAEVLAEQYAAEHGMRVHLPRPASIYGPGDDFGPRSLRLIPRLISRVRAGEEVEIWGSGEQTRSFVYVTDVVRAVLAMVEHPQHRVANIGTGEQVSVLELARLVGEALGRPVRIRTDPARPEGRSSRNLDLTRMRQIDGTEPVLLREGLRRTVAWYLGSAAELADDLRDVPAVS
ncbi:NAD-dependent epimerase/dehydratase family protein [Lentzea sp. JNUCC 0626]|uniref:NAD-dependent epimerase/dehydratase family protein n=1 Tax=Lentzea sp. JNUCC 0626 TaxID=3367513 RepID=UPI003748F0DA